MPREVSSSWIMVSATILEPLGVVKVVVFRSSSRVAPPPHPESSITLPRIEQRTRLILSLLTHRGVGGSPRPSQGINYMEKVVRIFESATEAEQAAAQADALRTRKNACRF